jgi:hypothetical protein
MDNHIGQSLQRNPLIWSSQATGKRKLNQYIQSTVFLITDNNKEGKSQLGAKGEGFNGGQAQKCDLFFLHMETV